MPRKYSQLKASLAIAKASLLAMLRSPTSVVFSILFPLIFIVVFGAMVDTASFSVKIAFDKSCDTSNMVYQGIGKIKVIHIVSYETEKEMLTALSKGRIAAIVHISRDPAYLPAIHYQLHLRTGNSASNKFPVLQASLNELVDHENAFLFGGNKSMAHITVEKIPGRVYQPIDFVLPGQLGFSLLMAGVFASAFLLFNLRQGLVLKRFFSTPIHRSWLILGEMMSRLFFQVIGFSIMVALGYFVFDFTLVNGFWTFLEMLLLGIFGLIIFMGIGFIISGVVRNESSIAPVANTITLPQILLCGLFFPVENYPYWLQLFCKLLPLTFFVDGLRKIAFEGIHIWQMPEQLLGLLCWTVVVSVVTVKIFRWE